MLPCLYGFYHVLANGNIFETDDKTNTVNIMVKDHFEARNIEHLSSQMKQELIDRMKDSIKALSKLKHNGRWIGSLKFKRKVNSIPLKQHGITYRIINKHYVRIRGIKQPIRVRGLFQIPKGAEIASTLLIRRHADYYLHVTTYQTKAALNPQEEEQSESIGIDLGIKNQLHPQRPLSFFSCSRKMALSWDLKLRKCPRKKAETTAHENSIRRMILLPSSVIMKLALATKNEASEMENRSMKRLNGVILFYQTQALESYPSSNSGPIPEKVVRVLKT